MPDPGDFVIRCRALAEGAKPIDVDALVSEMAGDAGVQGSPIALAELAQALRRTGREDEANEFSKRLWDLNESRCQGRLERARDRSGPPQGLDAAEDWRRNLSVGSVVSVLKLLESVESNRALSFSVAEALSMLLNVAIFLDSPVADELSTGWSLAEFVKRASGYGWEQMLPSAKTLSSLARYATMDRRVRPDDPGLVRLMEPGEGKPD